VHGDEDTGSPDVDRGIEAPAISTSCVVEVRFTDEMLTWEEFADNPTIKRLRALLDTFINTERLK
jgi:hypothetical protein